MDRKLITLFVVTLLIIFLGCSSKPLPDKGITILSPKANDALKSGGSSELLWKADPPESEFGAMVTVELSTDGGKSWELIKENVPNNGKFVWNVPKLNSAQCKIRVISQRRPIYRGTSEMFSIK